LILGPVLHFLKGICHAQGDDFVGIGATAGEAGSEFILAGRHDEEIDEGVLNSGI